MRDYRDAKAMAKSLREGLGSKGIILSHAECLELVARELGVKDWNTLAANIQAERPPLTQRSERSRWTGPVLLLRDAVIFPKQTAPLYIGRDASKRAFASANKGELEVVLVTQRKPEEDAPSAAGLYNVGVLADVLQRQKMQEAGGIKLLLRGRQRVLIHRLNEQFGFRCAEAELIPDEAPESARCGDMIRSAADQFELYAAANDQVPEAARNWIPEMAHPGRMADLIAQYAPISLAEKQALLETFDAVARLRRATALLDAAGASVA